LLTLAQLRHNKKQTARQRYQQSDPMTASMIYEHPLNEKMRVFLRLEYLFTQIKHGLEGDTTWHHSQVLTALLDILSAVGRSDIKNDVSRELKSYSASLVDLQHNDKVDTKQLDQLLTSIDTTADTLQQQSGQPGTLLREHELLNSIRQRCSAPGGLCASELPALAYWFNRTSKERGYALKQWSQDLHNLKEGLELMLKLLRSSAKSHDETADSGVFHKSLSTERPCKLARVTLAENSFIYPEISGGKHRISIRFMQQSDPRQRSKQTFDHVRFELACCAL